MIVCGRNMGDIFRRNSFNLGLHVVQSPEAVADARDGDEFTFDPDDAPAAERDPGQDLHAGAAVAEGRGDPSRRRHLRGRPARVPESVRDDAGDRLAGRRRAAPDDDDRADHLGAPGRQVDRRPRS